MFEPLNNVKNVVDILCNYDAKWVKRLLLKSAQTT